MTRVRSSSPELPQQATPLPPLLMPVAALIFLVGGVGPNIDLALIAVVVLVIGCALLWRPGEPPTMLLSFGIAWNGASIGIFHANWVGLTTAQHASIPGYTDLAITLSLTGLLALATGIRLGSGPWRPRESADAMAVAHSIPTAQWFRWYLAALASSFAVVAVVSFVPGLGQIILGFANLKWAFFYMLGYATFLRGGERLWLLIAFGIELALGVGGYFSDFKTVFLVTILAAGAARMRISLGGAILMTIMTVALIAFTITWTAVKTEYRDFVSAGNRAQSVNIDYATRMEKLYTLVNELDTRAFERGAEQFLKRLVYVDFFGATLDYVPRVEQHSNGAILADALSRPFMPRVLFPDKAIIDDTQRTNQYTGGLAGNYPGTSISLGYIAETYVDFGVFGMLPALLFIGYLYGRIFRLLATSRRIGSILGTSLTIPILFLAPTLENSFTKVFGGIIATLIAALLLIYFIVPRFIPALSADGRK